MGTDYRFSGNKPADFETENLRMFADSRHPKGQSYGRNTLVAGKPALDSDTAGICYGILSIVSWQP